MLRQSNFTKKIFGISTYLHLFFSHEQSLHSIKFLNVQFQNKIAWLIFLICSWQVHNFNRFVYCIKRLNSKFEM